MMANIGGLYTLWWIILSYSKMLAKPNLSPAERTGAVHGVLLAQAPQARLAEDMPTGLDLEWLME